MKLVDNAQAAPGLAGSPAQPHLQQIISKLMTMVGDEPAEPGAADAQDAQQPQSSPAARMPTEDTTACLELVAYSCS